MAEQTTRPPTHYDVLGVRPTASPQQIRRAFRDLSKLYHPDTTELPAAEATEKFQQLNEAYAVLSSPDRRWTYDKQVGYSRISVMQPLEPLSRNRATPRRKEISNLYLDPNDRPLSAGEIFALFILGITFVACLALVLTIGFTQGDTALNPVGPPAPEIIKTIDPEASEAVPGFKSQPPHGLSTEESRPSPPLADKDEHSSPESVESTANPSPAQAKIPKAAPAAPVWL